MSESLIGFITNYRIGPRAQRSKECIICFSNIKSSRDAVRLVGRKVAWPAEECKIRGKIVALHGEKGLVRARFRRGVPGQALGTRVEVIG